MDYVRWVLDFLRRLTDPHSLNLMANDLGGWLYAVLSSADVFSLWVVALYILGFSAAGKISKGQAAVVVVAIFAVKLVLKTAWAFFFQA